MHNRLLYNTDSLLYEENLLLEWLWMCKELLQWCVREWNGVNWFLCNLSSHWEPTSYWSLTVWWSRVEEFTPPPLCYFSFSMPSDYMNQGKSFHSSGDSLMLPFPAMYGPALETPCTMHRIHTAKGTRSKKCCLEKMPYRCCVMIITCRMPPKLSIYLSIF